MIRRLLISDNRGASAAEFALVLPLLLLLMLGIIDAGRYLWEINRAEKAAQMGARLAVVTTPVSTGLANQDYLGVGGLTQGDIIPASALSPISCERTSCACSGSCPTNATTSDADAFDRILVRMQGFKRDIAPSDVTIIYQGSGLGYAGNPHGMDISPIVTVAVSGAQFTPITTMFFGAPSFPLPSIKTTLTAEDSVGTASN
jgi:hypothetical protein